jgi:hypothetical protein
MIESLKDESKPPKLKIIRTNLDQIIRIIDDPKINLEKQGFASLM